MTPFVFLLFGHGNPTTVGRRVATIVVFSIDGQPPVVPIPQRPTDEFIAIFKPLIADIYSSSPVIFVIRIFRVMTSAQHAPKYSVESPEFNVQHMDASSVRKHHRALASAVTTTRQPINFKHPLDSAVAAAKPIHTFTRYDGIEVETVKHSVSDICQIIRMNNPAKPIYLDFIHGGRPVARARTNVLPVGKDDDLHILRFALYCASKKSRLRQEEEL